MTAKTHILIVLGALLAVLAFGVSSASAAEPWWQLSVNAAPTRLSSGSSRDEVQEIKVSATGGDVVVIEPVSYKEFVAGKVGFGELKKAEFAYDATHEAAQVALEGLYGSGNVEVSNGVGGVTSYVVTFKGALAGLPLELMNTEFGFLGGLVGEAKTTQVIEGKPDGQVIVRASNLGDLPVSGSTTPVTITDVLPPGVLATGIGLTIPGIRESEEGDIACVPSPPATAFPADAVTCTWSTPHPLQPYEVLEVPIDVDVEASAETGGENEVKVSGGEGYVCKKQTGGAFTSPFCAGQNNTEEEPSGSYEAESSGQVVAPVSLKHPLTVSAGATPFGVEEYRLTPENEGGSLDTQAGSHPFQVTTTITLNEAADRTKPPAFAKDLHFQWPAGLIGNTTALPQCTESQFATIEAAGASNLCPADTVVGVASVTIFLPSLNGKTPVTVAVPVFNLVPARGEPARFGFEVERAAVTINTSVRTGRDYAVEVSADNITELAAFISSRVTVWGVPGDAAHDSAHGWSCVGGGFFNYHLSPCAPVEQKQPPAFLSLPTSCLKNSLTGEPEPLRTSVEADSWLEPGSVLSFGSTEAMPSLGGCNRLPFAASLEVAPDVQQASSPAGLKVTVHVPQEVSVDGEGLAASDVRDTTVALPEGVSVNPASADGLQACTGDPDDPPGSPGNEIGFEGFTELSPASEPGARTAQFSAYLPGGSGAIVAGHTEPLQAGVNFCPDASKIATAKITVPVLAHPLEGAVYLAAPQNFSVLSGAPPENPFESLIALYLVAEDPVSGVLVKLPGKVSLSPTGQLTTTFENTPQAPFENLELKFFGGERAPLVTPALCRRPGEAGYQTSASFTPWSGNAAIPASTEFNITSGPGGAPCPNTPGNQSQGSLPFSPSLASGTTNNNAGAFSDLTTTLSRPSGDQNIQSVTLHYPAGLSGLLSGVALCPEAQANTGTCPEASLVGETTVSVGAGGDPYTVTGGKVYITEHYDGAPFGLSIVNPAKAGPFDLQEGRPVIVRAKIEVNPLTAALTVTAGPIPTIIEGIPLQIQHVNVNITKQGFTFNPTDCAPAALTGAISSDQGVSSPVSVPFQVTNCKSLKFEPKFAVSTSGKTSKADGASLVSKVTEPNTPQGTQANITKVKVELPKALPSRLTTLQKACTDAQFELNPANCPSASKIGYAVVHTPLLPVPLEGPAIFVSHGGEAFPSLTMVLQGYGVTIDLVGTTYISHAGITSTTFKTVPDQPFSSFELVLPEGPYSALAANGNLCEQKLVMPTEFVGQNGLEIHESTRIGVEGCGSALSVVSSKVKKRTLTLSVYAPGAGKVTASGKGVSSGSKSYAGREALTFTLKQKKAGRLKTKVKLTFTPSKGKKQSKMLAVRFGKARQEAKR